MKLQRASRLSVERPRRAQRPCRPHASAVGLTDVFSLQFKEELPMQGSTTDRASTGYVAIHPLDPDDAAITAAMRAMVSSSKGARPGIEARGQPT